MKDTYSQVTPVQTDATPEHSAEYLAARRDIEAARAKRERDGYAVMAVMTALDRDPSDPSGLPRVGRWARNFCVLFAFLAPSILLVYAVL